MSNSVKDQAAVSAHTAGAHGIGVSFEGNGFIRFIQCVRLIVAVDGDGNGSVDFHAEAAGSFSGIVADRATEMQLAVSPFAAATLGATKAVRLTVHKAASGVYNVTCKVDDAVISGTALLPSQKVIAAFVVSDNLAVFDAVANAPLPFAEAPASGTFTDFVFGLDSDSDGVLDGSDACPLETPSVGLDADLDGCTDTIAGLRAIVEGLSLKPNVEGGLLGKLEDAQKALDRGTTRVAENKLMDFIKQVEAQRGKALTTTQADLLVTYANNLIALI